MVSRTKRNSTFFDEEKIIIRQTSDRIIGTIDNQKRINLNNVYNIKIPKSINAKYLLGILNSKFIKVIYQSISQEKGRLFAEVKKVNLSKLPIMHDESLKIDGLVDQIIYDNNSLKEIANKFQKYLQQSFKLEKLSKKLQNWHELEFGEFIKELNKVIKTNNKLRVKDGLEEIPTLTKKDEFEWLDLFEDNKQKAQALQTQISQTDKEIDQMVYELYGLTEEEISIVENS